MDSTPEQVDPLEIFFAEERIQLKTIVIIDSIRSYWRKEGVADPNDKIIDLDIGKFEIQANCRGLDCFLRPFEINIYACADLVEEEKWLSFMQSGAIYCATCNNYGIIKHEWGITLTLYEPELTSVTEREHASLLELFGQEITDSTKHYTPCTTIDFIHMVCGARASLVGKLCKLRVLPTNDGRRLGYGLSQILRVKRTLVIFPEHIDYFVQLGPAVEIQLDGALGDFSEKAQLFHFLVEGVR